MTSDRGDSLERRVAILAPTRKDAILTQSLLEPAQVPSITCSTVEELVAAIAEGAAAVLIAEEMIAADGAKTLAAFVARQPAWSDLPLLATLVASHAWPLRSAGMWRPPNRPRAYSGANSGARIRRHWARASS